MDIAEFLTARYNEDEKAAYYAHASVTEAAGRGPIHAAGGDWRPDEEGDVRMYLPELGPREVDALVAFPGSKARAVHIARWNPARVLADNAAKRRRLERHSAHGGMFCVACDGAWPCEDVLNDASVYAEHPDFNPTWRIEA